MLTIRVESRNLHVYPLAYGIAIPVTLVAVHEGAAGRWSTRSRRGGW